MRIGIFGGSFNPIHNGHISLALQLKEKAGLDEVWLMVSPQNPLKQSGDLLDDEQRLQMARLAVEHVEGIVVSDYEMHLPKPSYTWNTLQALSRDYPDREFVLMIGGDNWELFDKWFHAADIKANYKIVVYPRKSNNSQMISVAENLAKNCQLSIVNCQLIDISSTDIRRRIREGRGIRRLVPKAVADYIKEKKLYI
ncbi:MAG: nicotinate-nucleotide adenylyltransferase [Prevotella sp.]|nr:nicotinate-nucleotide adenylyltransferase [Prevotella sp.]